MILRKVSRHYDHCEISLDSHKMGNKKNKVALCSYCQVKHHRPVGNQCSLYKAARQTALLNAHTGSTEDTPIVIGATLPQGPAVAGVQAMSGAPTVPVPTTSTTTYTSGTAGNTYIPQLHTPVPPFAPLSATYTLPAAGATCVNTQPRIYVTASGGPPVLPHTSAHQGMYAPAQLTNPQAWGQGAGSIQTPAAPPTQQSNTDTATIKSAITNAIEAAL